MVAAKLAKEDGTPNCMLVRASDLDGNEDLALATPGENYE